MIKGKYVINLQISIDGPSASNVFEKALAIANRLEDKNIRIDFKNAETTSIPCAYNVVLNL